MPPNKKDADFLRQVADILRQECHDKEVRFEADERNLRAFKGEQMIFHTYLEELDGTEFCYAHLVDHCILESYDEDTPRALADRLLVDLEYSDFTIKLGDDWYT